MVVTRFVMINGNVSRGSFGRNPGQTWSATDNRKFLDALLWMARPGGRWRDLPERLGDYRSVKRRYYRWIEAGVLDAMLLALAREADLEWLMINSTIVRASSPALVMMKPLPRQKLSAGISTSHR